MRSFINLKFILAALTITSVCYGATYTPQASPSQQPATTPSEDQQTPAAQLPQADLEAGLAAGEQWLKFIDSGTYTSSWDNGSLQFKTVVSKGDWDTAMKKLRQPLGTVKSRKLVDLRTAVNPPGVAKGDYIVLVYDTDFSTRPKAGELLTLVKESDGQWRVMSYFAR
ncbi:MAG: DUF4019 domain-containing protein [Parachlamydiales bacterium]|jgi:serine/threonine-protein kinase